jgi:diacylglycerol kinase family enzyme
MSTIDATTEDKKERVNVLVNPRSGLGGSLSSTLKAIETAWTARGAYLTYQFSNSVEDGVEKTHRAIADGVDVLIVVGGDGMVNTIGAELVGTRVAFGVIPAGSGNGFARHFNIPLSASKAAEALANADRKMIDVGIANGRPFFVTCSLAWDAALVRYFEKSPFRGILPYVFAGAQGFLEFQPQPYRILLDGREELSLPEPIVFTIANLTQFGGGAQIAPQACADDGYLELVVVSKQDLPKVMLELPRLFNGTLDQLSEVVTRRFRNLLATRSVPTEMQLDGELVAAPLEINIGLRDRALCVLVPRSS